MATILQSRTDDGYDLLLNRELSQVDLMRRVLELAADPSEPLLERVKFCGIVSSILDEFFMVRVAGLQDQVLSGLSVRSPDGRTPQQALAELRSAVLDLTAAQSALWRDKLCPALSAEGILVGGVEDATDAERSELEQVFSHQIFPVLTPLARASRSPTSRASRSASGCSCVTPRPARSASRV